jgi:hypothetical protein
VILGWTCQNSIYWRTEGTSEEEHASTRIGQGSEGGNYSSLQGLGEEKEDMVAVGSSRTNLGDRKRREGDNKGVAAA